MNQALVTQTSRDITFDGYLGSFNLPGINWQYFIDRRKGTLEQTPDLPNYLLLPEVERLMAVTKNDTQHFLFNTLMHTGARISEALLLTREDFRFDGQYSEVSIQTFKQRRGRPSAKKTSRPKRRLIALLDGDYIDEALRFFASNKGGLKTPLFKIDRSTAYRWIKEAEARLVELDDELEEDQVKVNALSIEVSPHTLRHSFAVNAILHWVPVPVLQKWMGHEKRESTEIYTQIFQTETMHFMAAVSYKSGIIK